MGDTLLSVSELNVSYGPVRAVRDVSLEVAAGEIVTLVGANGAGKSSTMWGILGLVPRTAAGVTFAGRDLAALPPEQIARAGLAIVPEGRRVFANLTVAENLRLGGVARRDGEPLGRDEVAELFPVLSERWTQLAGGLSGGQQQMLAIARALAARPSLMLLDEPSLGLSPKLVDEVFALMARLRATGLTLLLVEQNVRRSLEIADRAYVLQAGAVVLAGSASEVQASEAIESAFLGAPAALISAAP